MTFRHMRITFRNASHLPHNKHEPPIFPNPTNRPPQLPQTQPPNMPNPSWPTTIPILSATGEYLSPKTTSTTRLDFTDFFLRFRPAPDAHSYYLHLFSTHQKLAHLLIAHPAMLPNLQQTFSTPANSKNKVYFMWDFVLRTFQHLAAQVDPLDPESSPIFKDVLERSVRAKELIIDETGQLERMNARVGYAYDDGVEFTGEIKGCAATLLDLPELKGCAGCGKGERGDGRKLLVCAKCRGEMYCSVDCQRKRWKVHKKECQPAGEATA